MTTPDYNQLILHYAPDPWNLKFVLGTPLFSAPDVERFYHYCRAQTTSQPCQRIAGFLALDFHKVSDAKTLFSAILAQNPTDAWGRFGLARIHAIQNRLTEAIQIYETLILENPRHTAAMVGLGAVYIRKTHHAQAEQILNEALSVDPTHIDAKLELAILYQKINRPNEAIALLQSVVRPDSPSANYIPAWINLARLLDQLDRNAEAEHAYTQAIRLRPEDPLVRSWLAAFFQKTHQDAKLAALQR